MPVHDPLLVHLLEILCLDPQYSQETHQRLVDLWTSIQPNPANPGGV